MDRLELLTRNMVETITEDEAKEVLDKPGTKAYQGFEPSGLPHLGTGLLWPRKLNDLVELGIDTTVLLADWHAKVNDKLGGDIEMIRKSGRILQKSMKAMGISDKVKFVWTTDVVSDPEYWSLLLSVAKATNLARVRRALPIMGRTEDEADKDFSKYIYPLMQVTDIFYMDLDFAFGAMDQRHAHMLARDVAEKMGRKKIISIHGPLLGSLSGSGRMDSFKKMSKSEPSSAIFIFDSTEVLRSKIKKAFCPMKEVEGNPLIDIVRHIVIPYYHKPFIIDRPASKGGPIEPSGYKDFSHLYKSGEIHPVDLKESVFHVLDEMMAPARKLAETEDMTLGNVKA